MKSCYHWLAVPSQGRRRRRRQPTKRGARRGGGGVVANSLSFLFIIGGCGVDNDGEGEGREEEAGRCYSNRRRYV